MTGECKSIHGIYLTTRYMEKLKTSESGIYNKIISQYTVLSDVFDVCFYSFTKYMYYASWFLSRIPCCPLDMCWSIKRIPSQTAFIYLRFETGNSSLMRLLRKIKRNNPRCIIIVEFPTYPMEWASYSIIRKLKRYNYNRCTKALASIADRCIVYGNHIEAFGIPAIITQNGIDISSVRERKVQPTEEIRLISVSKMAHWHRIDRLLIGMSNYYKNGNNRDIKLFLVGTGSEYEKLKLIVEQNNLEKRVVFCGYLHGNELDDLFDTADIAVDGLTEHPKQNSSLKSREYWAKGMPVITSNTYSKEVSLISEYVLYMPADESPVDISLVVDMYDRVYSSGIENARRISNDIRSFAKENYDIKTVMGPVESYIKTNTTGS